jgi:hypothetical protein
MIGNRFPLNGKIDVLTNVRITPDKQKLAAKSYYCGLLGNSYTTLVSVPYELEGNFYWLEDRLITKLVLKDVTPHNLNISILRNYALEYLLDLHFEFRKGMCGSEISKRLANIRELKRVSRVKLVCIDDPLFRIVDALTPKVKTGCLIEYDSICFVKK